MIERLVSLLRQQHLDENTLQTVAEGVYLLPIPPAQADELWASFREAVAETGYWPLLTTGYETISLASNLHQEPLLASSVAIQDVNRFDIDAWLHAQGASDPFYRYPSSVWPEDRWCDDVLAHHDQLYRAHMAALGEDIADDVQDGDTAEWQLHQQWEAEAEAMNSVFDGYDVLVFIPSIVGWDIPMMISFGDTSRSPEPIVHSALLKRWSEQHGADLRALMYDSIELRARTRPITRCAALKLAWELQMYGPADDSYPPLTCRASRLLNNDLWTFWWD